MARGARFLLLALLLTSTAVALGADAGSSASGDFRCRGAIATIVGTAGDDRIFGTRHDDVIVARAGDDLVRARGGDDKICDNDGTDHVVAGPGDDEAGGGRGGDHIEGGPGRDWLAGRRGKDNIEGGAGPDRVVGELGDDTLLGNGGADSIGGGPGTDDCRGGPGRDRIRTCEEGDRRDDRPPVAADDADGTSEIAAKNVGVLANDSDPDGDPLSIAAVNTTGTTGRVTVTGGGSGVRYDPNGRFSSLAIGDTATDRFQYRLDGATGFATVTITVTGADTPPTAAADSGTVTEDDSAQPIDVLGNDTDPDAGAGKVIDSITQPANGTAAITGGGSGVTYEPDANYCNSPSAGSTDDFTYTLAPGGSNAEVAVTVSCVNDAPTLSTTGSALDYDEGAGAIPVDNGLSVTDVEGTLSGATAQITGNHHQSEDELAFTNQSGISGSYDDTSGTLTLTGDAPVTAYRTALRSITYENSSDTPDTGDRTVTFQATDTASAPTTAETRDIEVTPTNDAATVSTSGGATGYTEGGSASAVDNALTVADPDDTDLTGATVRISSGLQGADRLNFADTPSIAGTYDSGTGVLTLTGTDSVADYQTALRAVTYSHIGEAPGTAKTVEFRANDGDGPGPAATKSVTVTPVNDAPALVTTSGALSHEEGEGPEAIDAGLTVADPDSASLKGATVQITGGFVEAEDALAFANQSGITGTYDDTTGKLTLSGTTSLANYQTALRSVTYENSSDTPDTGARTVTFQVTDASDGASNSATRTIDVNPTNDAPTVTTTPGDTAYTEGDGATVIDDALTVSDPDDTNLESATVRISSGHQGDDRLTFVNTASITGNYDTGTGVLTLTGTDSVADYQAALQSVTFHTTASNPSASKTVEFKVNDGDADSNGATKDIAIAPLDSPPVVVAGGTLNYTENDAATAVHPGLTVTEPEGENITGAQASVTSGFQSGQDALGWTDNNNADNITLNGGSSSAQAIVLTGSDSAANYQAALRAVTYVNSSESPSEASRTVTFTADDGPATGSDTRTIAVDSVDDAPVAVDDDDTVTEDDSATAIPVLDNDTDVDAGPKTISSASDPANGTVVLTGGSPGEHTGLTYEPDDDYCNDAPLASEDTFTYTLNGGDTATVSMTVTCVNDAPVADDETFNGNDSAHGNTTLQVDDPDDNKAAPANPHTEITGDILAGDTDVDGPGPLTVTPGTFATNDGGSVTLEADGDFVYEPAASTSCTDTSDFFDYTVEDSASSDEQTDTGRVTIAIAGCVWYVSNDATGNSGTSTAPFDTLAQAETASGANHTVFVFDGDGTTTGYDTGFAMNAGERLIGEHEGLTVDPDQGGGLTADSLHPAKPGAKPTLTATDEDVVALDDGNEVRGFVLEPQGAGSGVAGASGDTGGGTFDDLDVSEGGTQPGVELDSTTGTFAFSNLTVSTDGAQGVRLANAGTATFAPTGTISITTAAAKALDAVGAGFGTSTFDDITVTGATNGAVDLTNTTGTVVFGDGNGTDLDLSTASGSPAAFRLNSAGTASVPDGGTANVSATGGPAVDITGTTTGAGGYNFDDVDSTGSASDGINLAGLGAGTFSAGPGSTIAGATGISFDLDGGSGDVTFPGALSNGTGQAAEISNRSGGAVAFSGPVGDTSDAGGGIALSANSGGSTTFSNATKTINTTTSAGGGNPVNNAVTMIASNGHTLNLTGGTLDIDTTVGKGLEADNSGTLVVAGSGNTIDSTTGRPLNVSDTDIGASDITLQRVSSNGASNGLRLNNTGAGNFTVTGSGGTCTIADTTGCSGGAILSSTAAGVDLNNVGGAVGLTRMRVNGSGDDGIRATGVVGGVDVDTSVITSNGNAVGENGIDWTDVRGGSAINATAVSGSAEHNARISSNVGTHNLDVTGSTFASNSTTLGGTGLLITGGGTATVNADVTTSVMQANRDVGFQVSTNAGGTGAMNVNFLSNDVLGGNGGAVSGQPGILMSSGNSTDLKALVQDNEVSGSRGSAMIVGPTTDSTTASTHEVTVQGNTIGADTAGSGSAEGIAVFLQGNGAATTRIAVKNNDISHWAQNAMRIISGEKDLVTPGLNAAASADFTITGNVMANGDATRTDTISLIAGVQSGAAAQSVCADIGGAAALANAFGGTHGAGAGDFDLQISERFAADLRFPGFAGDGSSQSAIETFVRGRNTGNPTVALIDNAISGGAACVEPTLPPG